MVFVMRLVLALTAILTLFVAPGDLGNRYGATTVLSALIFGGYLLHSLTLLLAAPCARRSGTARRSTGSTSAGMR
jgi:hypothetical protein